MSISLQRGVTCGLLFFAFTISQLFAAPAHSGATATIFRIGTFDRSSGEFADGDPKQNVDFVVNRDTAAKDWFRSQPAVLGSAPATQKVRIAAAPRAITFSLEGSPAATYQLHIAVLIESPSVPALKIGIDGRQGLFYLQPHLNYSGGDQGGSFDPVYSAADVEFTFPGSDLHAGANTITVQAVEEAEADVPDAAITYDAIELDSGPRDKKADAVSAQLVPTVFFVRKNGQLEERVDAFIRSGGPIGPGGSAELTIGDRRYRSDLAGGFDFGKVKAEFMVPEFTPKSKTQLTVKFGGRSHRFNQLIDPKKKWTIFVVPHIHVDVGYSDYQAKVSAIQARTIDEAMNMTAQHPDFRFSLDGEWDLEQFMETRTAAEHQRAIEAIQKQQLFVPAQYANLLTGLPTAETLIRSLYPSADFSRKYGTPFNYANITDVPSYSWSYASILAAAGIPYLAAGSDNYRGPVLLQGRLNKHSPMWWVGPDGKRVLLWYSRHYMQMQMLFGMPSVPDAGNDTLPLFLQMYEGPDYQASATIIFGTQVENTDLFPDQAELAQEWNSTHAYPHLQYAGFHEALKNIQNQFGDNIPTIRGDGGPYWEDGAGSDAYYLAIERHNEAQAPTAEKLATLTSLVNPLFAADKAGLDRMWQNMVLMEEHTWDSYNSITQPTSSEAVDQLAIKDQHAVNAAAEADFLLKRSMANLADAIPAGRNSLIVFNSLNWMRSGPVTFDLPKGDEIADSQTNQPVPIEVLQRGNNFAHVRFIAKDVPAVGYKVYLVRPRTKAPAPAQTEQGLTIESPYYRVQLDPETGAVRSIYDKDLHRELVSQNSTYRFGEYLYVTGGDKAPNSILQYSPVSPKPELEVHPAHSGRVISVEQTAFGEVAHLESTDVNTPSIKTEIRLFNNEKKIEFVEDVDKKPVYSKEAVYFAFPFAMDHPRFQYEIQTGVVDPSKDMYPGAGHEWFTVQHWVSVEQDGLAGTVMPLDAPLVTLGDINRGAWPETFGTRPGTIFSYVMNNYWDTNYRAEQGGHCEFRYVVTSADATRPGELSHVGWEEVTPLEADLVTSQDKAVMQSAGTQKSTATQTSAALANLDARQDSFLDTGDSNVLLEAWKPAEDGNGTILRFLDLSGAEHTVNVRIPFMHLAHVWQTDAVERGQGVIERTGDNSFYFTIHPHEIVTIRAVAGRQ